MPKYFKTHRLTERHYKCNHFKSYQEIFFCSFEVVNYNLFLFPDSSEFTTQWEADPDDTKKNQSFVYYTVGNLQPNTGYQFRIIAWNEVGASEPSDPSNKVFTGQLLGLCRTIL